MTESVQCPVCTLYLHANMRLSDHLETHPKEQVIKALVALTISGGGAVGGLLGAALAGPSPGPAEQKPEAAESLTSKHEQQQQQDPTNSGGGADGSAADVPVARNQSLGFISSPYAGDRGSCENGTPKQTLAEVAPTSVAPSSAPTPSATPSSSSTTTSTTTDIKTDGEFESLHAGRLPTAAATYQQRSAKNVVAVACSAPPATSEGQVAPADFSLFAASRYQQPQQQQQQQPTAAISQLSLAAQHVVQGHRSVSLPLPPPPPSALPHQQPQSQFAQVTNHPFHMPPQVAQVAQPGQVAASLTAVHRPHSTITGVPQQQTTPTQAHPLRPVYASNLPPPPPLQLFSYQPPSGHPPPHQKPPPPAYGTAISQIRSQHNQTKQHALIPPQHQHQHQQQQHQPPASHLAQLPAHQAPHIHQALRCVVPHQVAGGLSKASTSKDAFVSKQTTQFPTPPSPPPPPPPPPAHVALSTASSTQQLQKYMHDLLLPPQQQLHAPHPPPAQPHQPLHDNEATPLAYKPTAATAQRVGGPLASNTALQSNNDSNNATAAATSSKLTMSVVSPAALTTPAVAAPNATATLRQTANSPSVAVQQSAPQLPPPPPSSPALSTSSSSVLRYAESPVAHYLERDNGDFIVQETPKHIVECVEKDNGEFFVIERIYQSPPSVLRIHDDAEDRGGEDDDDDDDDGGDNAEPHVHQQAVHVAAEIASAVGNTEVAPQSAAFAPADGDIDDDEEFMSIASDTDDTEDFMSEKERKQLSPKKRSSSTSAGGSSETTPTTKKAVTLSSSPVVTVSGSPSNSAASSNQSQSSISGSNSNSSNSSQSSSSSASNLVANTPTGAAATRRKTSKNTITVLSDVQLNHSEYLDLVGTFRKMSKVSQRQTTFSAKVPIPFVKVEKEEPLDDYEFVQPTSDHEEEDRPGPSGSFAAAGAAVEADEPQALTGASMSKPTINANKQETDELYTHNRSRTEHSLSQQLHAVKGKAPRQPANAATGAVGLYASQMTSVIRMASTTQYQPAVPVQLIYAQPIHRTNAAHAECEQQIDSMGLIMPDDLEEHVEEHMEHFVAEDLSKPQPREGQQQDAVVGQSKESPLASRRATPVPVKKGPKKLIIKPKSLKPDGAALGGSGFAKPAPAMSMDDNPCTSVKAQQRELANSSGREKQAQRQRGARHEPEQRLVHEMQIKSEPNTESSSAIDTVFGGVSILEQHLQPGGIATDAVVCKQEQQPLFVHELGSLKTEAKVKAEHSGETVLSARFRENVDDARVLLDFANSKKHSTSVNFLSSGSIFSAASGGSTAATTAATATTPAAASTGSAASAAAAADSSTSAPVSAADCSTNQSMDAVLRCDDEFIATDGSDVQEIVISSSYSSQSASDVALRVRGEVSAQHTADAKPHHYNLQQLRVDQSHQHQHQQAQHSFNDYSFSFLYGGHSAGQPVEGGVGGAKMGFSPLYQAAQDNTTAATLASGSTSVTIDDSQTSGHGMSARSTNAAPPQQPPQLSRFGAAATAGAGNHGSSQWYNGAPGAGNSAGHFEAALAVDCSVAVDGCGGAVSKYLDLDTCKREHVAGEPAAPPSSSTSSSFTGATESSLAGGCTTDALNIRTDEKMPAKGEISEQESNCDIENSWSQPMYGDLSARFFKTSFPAFLQQEQGWQNDDYFAVQDLSANTTAATANAAGGSAIASASTAGPIRPIKSFEFHIPLEANSSPHAGSVDLQPSTSAAVTIKKKRKRSETQPHHGKMIVARGQPTATITSQQLLFHQQQQQQQQQAQQQPQPHPGQEFTFQLPAQHSLVVAGPSTVTGVADEVAAGCVGPSTSAAAAAAAAAAVAAGTAAQKARKKVYQCTHCMAEFVRLKDRNSHLIDEHNYVRHNRRLICARAHASATAISADLAGSGATAASGGALTNSSEGVLLAAAAPNFEIIEDSKQGIVKIEMDNGEQATPMAIHSSLEPKSELIDAKDGFAFIPANTPGGVLADGTASLTAADCSALDAVDTKPNLQQPLAMTSPASKLAALYRMLVSFNIAMLKQHQHLTEFEEKLIETSIFFCYVCRRNFTSVKMYDAHLTEHPAECFTCGKKFQRWKNFSLHLKRHLGWKEFGCSVCEKKFVVRSALVEHMRMHTGQTPLKCKICGKSFKRYSNLTQHRKRHGRRVVRKKEYVCHCGEVLPSKSRFIWHKETHDAKPKCCPYCCDRFVHANSLRRHIRLAHSDKFDYTEPMECPMCKQIFSKSSIKAHMATHSMETQHDCAICNKSFSTKWNLKMHSWVHANRTAKPFKCEHCPKAFVREVDLKNHMNAHKQIKPYTCEYCGCKFIRKYNYLRHRREHHGNKKFTCDFCKKSFHRHYYLIEHRRIHTGERPFVCTICGKSSTTKTNHNKHLKIHHSRDPFTVEA